MQEELLRRKHSEDTKVVEGTRSGMQEGIRHTISETSTVPAGAQREGAKQEDELRRCQCVVRLVDQFVHALTSAVGRYKYEKCQLQAGMQQLLNEQVAVLMEKEAVERREETLRQKLIISQGDLQWQVQPATHTALSCTPASVVFAESPFLCSQELESCTLQTELECAKSNLSHSSDLDLLRMSELAGRAEGRAANTPKRQQQRRWSKPNRSRVPLAMSEQENTPRGIW